MPELNHTPAPPAIGARPRLRFAPPGFARTTLAPVGLLAAALAAVAASEHHWRDLPLIVEAMAAAVLLRWAITTHAAARRHATDHPIHPTAAVVARAVLWVGIAAGLTVCGLTLFAPNLLGLTAGGVR
jgi:hypothetical protein